MPGSPTSEMADDLRSKARAHPTLVTLGDRLVECEGAPTEDDPEGLYVDTEAAPGIVVNGELRVSVARVHSVTDEGVRLVGQAQAVRVVDHPLASWELRLFVHVPEHFHTQHFEDAASWFLRVLDLHYAEADEHVEMEPQIEA